MIPVLDECFSEFSLSEEGKEWEEHWVGTMPGCWGGLARLFPSGCFQGCGLGTLSEGRIHLENWKSRPKNPLGKIKVGCSSTDLDQVQDQAQTPDSEGQRSQLQNRVWRLLVNYDKGS